MRAKAYLEPLRGKPKKLRFATLDIETKDRMTQRAGFTRPFLAGIYDGISFKSFRTKPPVSPLEEPDFESETAHLAPGGCIDLLMRECLTKKFRGWTFYAHFGGIFDYLHLLPWLRNNKDRYSFRVIPVQSTIQMLIVTCKTSKSTYTFLDSGRLLPMALQKAAKAFKHEGKVTHDLDLHEDDPSWEIYLKGDCVQLYRVMTSVVDLMVHKLGGEVGVTAPASSMKLFRRKYLEGHIERHAHFMGCEDKACKGCLHRFIRQGYYGGRTEIFHKKLEGLHYYDFNSSYPASMREPMPVGRKIEAYGKISDVMREDHVAFVEARVKIPKSCYLPPLPVRGASGKLNFPVGEFEGVWDLAELDLLKHPQVRGKILEIKRVVWYRARPVFRKMVEDLYTLRDKSSADYDSGLSELAKLILNSLYGKFGMNPEKEELLLQPEDVPGGCILCSVPISPNAQLCSDCVGSKRADPRMNTGVWYRPKTVDAPYIIPQISAHITALSRVKLFHEMAKSIALGGKLMMVDTDSVLTTAEMISSTALGALKDEYPGETLECEALQPKVYILQKTSPFGGEHEAGCQNKACAGCSTVKIAAKGIPKAHRTLANMHKLRYGQELCEQLAGERKAYLRGEMALSTFRSRARVLIDEVKRAGTVTFERLEKVRSLARVGFSRPPRMVSVTKSLRSQYDKRLVLPDGSTRPLILAPTVAEISHRRARSPPLFEAPRARVLLLSSPLGPTVEPG